MQARKAELEDTYKFAEKEVQSSKQNLTNIEQYLNQSNIPVAEQLSSHKEIIYSKTDRF